jgi:hypothetical protein
VRAVAVLVRLSAAVALATAASAASAATVEMPYVGRAAAVAGDSIVGARWSSDGKRPGAVRIGRRDSDGTTTTLATIPAVPASRSTLAGSLFYTVSLRSSATMWALAVRAGFHPDDGEEAFTSRGETIVSGAVAGGAPRVLERCKLDTQDGANEAIAVAVAGDDVAWSDAMCPGAEGVRLATGAGQPELVGGGGDVALTPAAVGYRTYDAQRGVQQIAILDRGTGVTKELDTGYVSDFALADAGLAAVIADAKADCPSSCRQSILRVASDGTVVRPGLAPTYGGPLVAGGGRVLARRAGSNGNGVVAVDMATGSVSYAGLLGLDAEETDPIAVDATRAVYFAPRCDGRPVLFFEDTVAVAPTRLDVAPCPIRVLRHTATLRLHERRARIRVRCPQGCSGSGDDWTVRDHGADVGELHVTVPRGGTGYATLVFYELGALRNRRSAFVTLAEDSGRLHTGAPRQTPIRLRLRIRP